MYIMITYSANFHMSYAYDSPVLFAGAMISFHVELKVSPNENDANAVFQNIMRVVHIHGDHNLMTINCCNHKEREESLEPCTHDEFASLKAL